MSNSEHPDNTRLATPTLLAYGAPMAALSVMGMPLIVYLPAFYAEETGISMAAVGGLFTLARLWDAVIDPLIGNWSDRTETRWGRRKPWLALGTPFLMVAFYLFAQPPEDVGVAYLLVSAFAFYVAFTVAYIPYMSWGAELARDYEGRTRVGSFREGGQILGSVIATAFPLLILPFVTDGDPSLREILAVLAITTIAMLAVSVPWALFVTPDAQRVNRPSFRLRAALGMLRHNRPLLRLLTGVFFLWLGGAVFNALIVFVVPWTLGLGRGDFLWFVFVQYLIGLVSLPIAVKLANRYGRHRALVVGGMAFFALHPLFLIIPDGGFWWTMALFVLAGLTTAYIWVMPPALIADTVEYGMLKGGGDDVALYMALYQFVQKLALALGVGIALPLAGATGFLPQGPNDNAALYGLNATGLLLPGVLAAIGAIVLYGYPITAARHAVIRRALIRRGILAPETRGI